MRSKAWHGVFLISILSKHTMLSTIIYTLIPHFNKIKASPSIIFTNFRSLLRMKAMQLAYSWFVLTASFVLYFLITVEASGPIPPEVENTTGVKVAFGFWLYTSRSYVLLRHFLFRGRRTFVLFVFLTQQPWYFSTRYIPPKVNATTCKQLSLLLLLSINQHRITLTGAHCITC